MKNVAARMPGNSLAEETAKPPPSLGNCKMGKRILSFLSYIKMRKRVSSLPTAAEPIQGTCVKYITIRGLKSFNQVLPTDTR